MQDEYKEMISISVNADNFLVKINTPTNQNMVYKTSVTPEKISDLFKMVTDILVMDEMVSVN